MRRIALAGLFALLSGCAMFDDYDDHWMYAEPVPVGCVTPAAYVAPAPTACGCGRTAPPVTTATSGWNAPAKVAPIPAAAAQSREPDVLRR